MDERPDVPEVLPPFIGDPGVDSVESGQPPVSAGEGGMPVSREGELGEDVPDEGLDRDQIERQAWFRSARGMIMAYWHDPRTAIKYAIAVFDAVIDPEIDHLKLEPQDIPPVTEKDVGWQ